MKWLRRKVPEEILGPSVLEVILPLRRLVSTNRRSLAVAKAVVKVAQAPAGARVEEGANSPTRGVCSLPSI